MNNCAVCEGQEFYLESGFYFCKECQTQQEGTREQVVDFSAVDSGTRLRRTRIRKIQSTQENITGWTTWEKYNFIMIGLANQLIDLGASTDIKQTLLQLWATYLGKLEVAFKSTTEKSLPKLARRYDQRDAQIIYGSDSKIKKRKKVRKFDTGSATSVVSSSVSRHSAAREFQKKKKLLMKTEYKKYLESQGDSDVDRLSGSNVSVTSTQTNASSVMNKPKQRIYKSKWWLNKTAREEARQAKILAKKLPKNEKKKFQEKHMSTTYSVGPGIITAKRIWAILYLALRINDEKIHISDMLRYAREGHLSYYRLEHFFPAEITLTTSEINKLNPVAEIGYKGLRAISNTMAKFLKVWQITDPNLVTILRKFCTELQLPEGVFLYAERMMASSPPEMGFSGKSVFFPNYEGRVMAIIIVVMKILFGLDGITENKISQVIERINLVAEEKGVLDSRLFNFREWQRYIECRRCILINEHLPTKLKRDPSSPANSHLYIKFIQSIESKREADENEKRPSSYIPQQLASAMKQGIERLQLNDLTPKGIPSFPPSLTPQYSYLQQLLQDPNKDLPSILRQDFSSTKVGYITRPESLLELAVQCDIELNYVDVSPHFVEKIVPTFEPPFLLSIREQRALNLINQSITVITPSFTESLKFKKLDNPSEYLHRKHPGKIDIDSKKQRLYNKMQRSKEVYRKYENVEINDFEFDQVHPDGKLKIPEDEDESSDDNTALTNIKKDYNLILSNFERQTLLGPVENPWDVEKKFRHTLKHKGRFVKKDSTINNNAGDNAATKKSNLENVDEITIEDDDDGVTGDSDDSMVVVEEASDCNLVVSDSDEISILAESIESKQNNADNLALRHEQMTFFRPFKEYWIRRSQHFSHISSQHFRLLERNLPVNFRWLLYECAHIVEMNIEELYREVCLVENYFGCVVSKSNNLEICKKYNSAHYQSTTFQTSVRNKWKT